MAQRLNKLPWIIAGGGVAAVVAALGVQHHVVKEPRALRTLSADDWDQMHTLAVSRDGRLEHMYDTKTGQELVYFRSNARDQENDFVYGRVTTLQHFCDGDPMRLYEAVYKDDASAAAEQQSLNKFYRNRIVVLEAQNRRRNRCFMAKEFGP
jgi:hypothetical protein